MSDHIERKKNDYSFLSRIYFYDDQIIDLSAL